MQSEQEYENIVIDVNLNLGIPKLFETAAEIVRICVECGVFLKKYFL